MIYLILFVLLAILGISTLGHQIKNHSLYNVFFLLIFCLFIGLRQSNIGRDTAVYEQAFNSIVDLGYTDLHMEVGFLCLNQLVVFLGGGFTILLLLSAFIPLLFVCKSILYFKVDNVFVAYISLLCSSFLLVYLFSGIRQGIAMGIVLYAYKFIVEKKLRCFTLCIVCASFFHLTAVFAYPTYWLTKKIPFWLLVCLTLIALLCTNIGITKHLFSIFISLFSGHYGSYADLYADFGNSDTGYGIILRIVFWLLIAYVLSNNILSFKHQIVYNILSLGIIAYSFFLGVDILIRLSEYFMIILIIAIPYSLQSLRLKSNRFIYCCSYLLVLCVIYYFTLTFDDIRLLPYVCVI